MTDTSLENIGSPAPQRFLFTANGGDFFGIAIKNFFLTIITLGVYWFWAKVEITKFLYNNTKFQESSFDYHATGLEKFIGFLKGIGILLVYGIFIGIVTWILTKAVGESTATTIVTLLSYLIIFSVLPIIIIGALRFRLSRTSFHGIRFQFLGEPKEFTILFLKSVGLTIVTFGFYYPWAIVAISTYIARNCLYGNHAFDLRVKAEELFFTFIKGFLLSLVTCGIYSFWFRADLHNFFWNNYYFQNGKTISDLKGDTLFITFLKSVGLMAITCGIGFAWVIIMNQKVIIESLSFSTNIDFDSISNIPINPGAATIDSIGGDALDSFGFIAG